MELSTELLTSIEALPVSPAEHAWLRHAMEDVTPRDTIRHGIGTSLETHIEAQQPGLLATYQRFHETNPLFATKHSRFSMSPLPEAFISLVYAAKLLHPEQTLFEAAQAMTYGASRDLHEQNPIFKPLMIACDNDLRLFLNQLPGSFRLFFGAGTLAVDWPSEKHAVLHYEDVAAKLLKVMLPGVMRGQFEVFGLEHVSIEPEILAPRLLTVDLTWP